MNVSAPSAPAVQSTQRPTQSEQTARRSDLQKPAESAAAETAPKQAAPVVNTQGQTTGRILNVVA
jgi:hypothetical protein